MPATGTEPYGKKSSMGSENRQRSFKGNLKSSVTRSIAPKRVALENRRYLPERLLLPSSRYAQTEAQKGCEYSTSSATYAVKHLGGTDRIMADFRTSVSTFGGSRFPSSSSCRTAGFLVRAGTELSVQAVQRDRNECIASTDRPCLLSRPM